MTFCYDIDPHVVKVIRNSPENGTDMSINVRVKGDARVFWASDWDEIGPCDCTGVLLR
jgi:hypothetical protein